MADHMESSPSMVGSGDHRAGVSMVGVDPNRAGDHGLPMVGVANASDMQREQIQRMKKRVAIIKVASAGHF